MLSVVRLYLHYICVTFVCYSTSRCHVMAATMRHVRTSVDTNLLRPLVARNDVELAPNRELDGSNACAW